MVLEGEALRLFSIDKIISDNKRNHIRKGLKRCALMQILDLEDVLERVRQINISQAKRQESKYGAEVHARRYIDEADDWRAQVRREYALRGREWMGAFVDNVLVAYIRTYQVGGLRVIEQVKADTQYLKHFPIDALYYSVLSGAGKDNGCKSIVNGSPIHASLDRYKEQFLFKAKEHPYYSTNARLIEWAKRRLS